MRLLSITVAAFQVRAIYEDISQSLSVIKKALTWAEKRNVDIICFPECFLQGYILNGVKARKVGLDLDSEEFNDIVRSLFSNRTTIILGLIEKERSNVYNTAVVIEKGKLIGKYRKHYIHNKENFFTCGTDFPIFKKSGIKYGINICYDSRFPESAEAIVKQGAQIIFCPLNNSLSHAKADEWKDKHIQYFIDKAQMSGCWIISADVVEKSEINTGYGCTSLVSPKGEVVEYLEHLKEGKFLKKIAVD